MPSGILIVDDHPLFIEALELVIQGTFPNAKVSKATSIDAARAVLDKHGRRSTWCCSTCRCRERAGSKGSSSCARAIPSCPSSSSRALEDARIIHEVMQCGAAGYISKSTRGADLGRALEDVMSGSVVLPKGYQPPPPPALPGRPTSPRASPR